MLERFFLVLTTHAIHSARPRQSQRIHTLPNGGQTFEDRAHVTPTDPGHSCGCLGSAATASAQI
jgi:hypothetical protein